MNPVLHISVPIARPPQEVYDFASKLENLPLWASGLDASALGSRVKVRFAARNDLGVLDHEVTLETGERFHNPMRVLPNDAGSEIVFTLFKTPQTTDEKFAGDAEWVRKDLLRLKALLENRNP